MTNVYFYHPSTATYPGNGGMVFLAQVGDALQAHGFKVHVFDVGFHSRHLCEEDFAWLGLERLPFELVAVEQVLEDTKGVIVGTWLRTLIPFFEEHLDYFNLLNRFIMRDGGHLLRAQMAKEREFAKTWVKYVSVNNLGLMPYYILSDIIPKWFWPHWVEDFFFTKSDHARFKVGVQPGPNNGKVYHDLVEEFGENSVLLCNGTRREVAKKMQQCSIFVSWNTHELLLPGDGESFGRSLSEAMAAGCVIVSRRSCGNIHYKMPGGTMPFTTDSMLLYDNWRFALDGIGNLFYGSLLTDILRAKSQHKAGCFSLSNVHIDPIVSAINEVTANV